MRLFLYFLLVRIAAAAPIPLPKPGNMATQSLPIPPPVNKSTQPAISPGMISKSPNIQLGPDYPMNPSFPISKGAAVLPTSKGASVLPYGGKIAPQYSPVTKLARKRICTARRKYFGAVPVGSKGGMPIAKGGAVLPHAIRKGPLIAPLSVTPSSKGGFGPSAITPISKGRPAPTIPKGPGHPVISPAGQEIISPAIELTIPLIQPVHAPLPITKGLPIAPGYQHPISPISKAPSIAPGFAPSLPTFPKNPIQSGVFLVPSLIAPGFAPPTIPVSKVPLIQPGFQRPIVPISKSPQIAPALGPSIHPVGKGNILQIAPLAKPFVQPALISPIGTPIINSSIQNSGFIKPAGKQPLISPVKKIQPAFQG